MDFNSVHSPEKIKHLRRRILGLKMYRWLLVVWQFVPIALGVAYVISDSWRAAMIVLFLLSVVLTWYLHRKIGEVMRRINVLEMTVIAYRVENGERFLPDHKDYALYRQMLFTLLGSDKKR
jgi:hypothetical protein